MNPVFNLFPFLGALPNGLAIGLKPVNLSSMPHSATTVVIPPTSTDDTTPHHQQSLALDGHRAPTHPLSPLANQIKESSTQSAPANSPSNQHSRVGGVRSSFNSFLARPASVFSRMRGRGRITPRLNQQCGSEEQPGEGAGDTELQGVRVDGANRQQHRALSPTLEQSLSAMTNAARRIGQMEGPNGPEGVHETTAGHNYNGYHTPVERFAESNAADYPTYNSRPPSFDAGEDGGGNVSHIRERRRDTRESISESRIPQWRP